MAPKVEVENSAEQSDNEVFEDENKNTEEKNEPENDCCGSHSAHSCHSEGEKSCCETEHEVSVSETDDFSVLKGGEKIDSWMCKTCNCIFLNEVSPFSVNFFREKSYFLRIYEFNFFFSRLPMGFIWAFICILSLSAVTYAGKNVATNKNFKLT